jgi:hypothetical protein
LTHIIQLKINRLILERSKESIIRDKFNLRCDSPLKQMTFIKII